jgi:hypothetical protein
MSSEGGWALVAQSVSRTCIYRGVQQPSAVELAQTANFFRNVECHVPRITAESILDGHCRAQEFDSGGSRIPLPYIRERRVIGVSELMRR